MTFEIRACRAEELAPLISLLDAEFIFAKERSISLLQRFPGVFSVANLGNLLVCKEGERVVSALAIRKFKWHEGADHYDGAMIGTVYTHPARRGQGHASHLLAMAAERLRDQGVDFCVLWAGQASFYKRLGWASADSSVLGTATLSACAAPADPTEPANDAITRMPLEEMPSAQLEALRTRSQTPWIQRPPGDFRNVPIPAECAEIAWRNPPGASAYALFGRCGETTFLYELAGDAACFSSLWQSVCRGARRVVINDRLNSPSHRWLATHTSIAWQEQALTLWLPLSGRIDVARLAQWHIPYFDRI